MKMWLSCGLGTFFLCVACSSLKKIPEPAERSDISGVWVLADREIAKNIGKDSVASSKLLMSDTILISYDGEGYYSVKSIKNVGESLKVNESIVMYLDYKGAPNSCISGDFTILTDADHFLRFSSNKSPESFDLEIKKKGGATDQSDWVMGGKYLKRER